MMDSSSPMDRSVSVVQLWSSVSQKGEAQRQGGVAPIHREKDPSGVHSLDRNVENGGLEKVQVPLAKPRRWTS